MNDEDKLELIKWIKSSMKNGSKWTRGLCDYELEYLLKAIEAFEHPQPLDAGEQGITYNGLAKLDAIELFKDYWQGEIPWDEKILVEYPAIINAMEDFAQASITAKEKEWEREKAEDEEAATERIANTISSFMDHCKENGLDIPDSYFESYLNA